MRPTPFGKLLSRSCGALRASLLPLAFVALALVAALPATLAAQAGTVAGTVVSEATMRPLPGAQVVVEGTQRGTVADQAGRFILPGLTGQQVTLRVSMIGYRSVTRTVAVGATDVRIGLTESAVALDEVVVTGTVGGTERRAIGNTVASIRARDVVDVAPIPNIQSLLNARAPGVIITPGTGQVGSGSQIRIRGSSSLSLSNTPLLYVDGVRVDNAQNTGPVTQAFNSSIISRINDFNPDDIESIEIIKGPAAATLYGTEAANGVIQIITRRGVAGAPTWDVTVRQGGNWFANADNRVPTNYWRNPATGEMQSINYAQTERARGNPLWRTGHTQNYNLGLSGGTTELRYHLSGFFDREEGPDWDNDLRRAGGRVNLTVTPSSRISIAGSMGYTSADFSLACEGGCGGTTWASYFSTPFHAGTNDPNRVQLEDGTDRRRGARSFVPEYYWNVTDRTQNLGRFTGSVQATHTPIDWFSHRLTFGIDDSREDNQTLTEITDIYREWSPTGTGGKDVGRREVNTTTVDYSGTFSFGLMPGLMSRTSFGTQYYNRLLKSMTATGSEFALPGLRVINATNPDERGGFESFQETISLGVFGQQEFGWQDRRFLTLGLRADDHSAFGEDFTMVYYPKISGAWVVSEEPFWRLPLVSDLRLRAAFGMAGEQPGAFDALRTFNAVAGPGGQATVTPATIGNPELGPEKGQEFEFGFDAGFLDGRAGLDFTFYNQRTRDAIILQPIAPSTGFPGSRFLNLGELRNFGWEAMVRAQPLSRRNFIWDATFSIARNDSEIVDIGEQDEIQIGFGVTHRPGYPIASWFNQRVVDAQFDPVTQAVIQASMICDDGQGGTVPCYTGNTITAPRIYLGRSEPLHEGAFTSTFTLFDRFRVYGLMDFKTGFKKWDHVLRVRCSLNNTCPESRQGPLAQGQPTGGFVDPSIAQSAEFQNDPMYRAMLASFQRGDNFGDTYTNDASFLRFREVSLTYSVPPQFAQRVGATRATVSVAARNLYTFTDWTGMDPEARFLGGARGLFGGLEQNHLPQSTSFVTSVNFSF
jgi:TonB-linked SusC/RagA family outer membrane protein